MKFAGTKEQSGSIKVMRSLYEYFTDFLPFRAYRKGYLHSSLHTKQRAIVFDKHKAAYMDIPKTGCSSIKIALARFAGIGLGRYVRPSKHIHRFKWPFVFDERIRELRNRYLVFSFVRNPWDRLLSCYCNTVFIKGANWPKAQNGSLVLPDRFVCSRVGMPFEDFISCIVQIPDKDADIHFRSQHTFIEDSDGNILPHFIGRFENLQNDFSYICNKIGIPAISLPHFNKTEHKHYSHYYSQKAREAVRKRYSKDIELFGYKFETA